MTRPNTARRSASLMTLGAAARAVVAVLAAALLWTGYVLTVGPL